MKIALCQINPVVGDIDGNCALIEQSIAFHKDEPVDLFVFPELCIQGYPPRDLLEADWFISKSTDALFKLCAFSKNIPDTGILVGIALAAQPPVSRRLTNSAVLICNGAIRFVQEKSLLPTYDVFDESRYFEQASKTVPIDFKGERLGITICEDIWTIGVDSSFNRQYSRDPVTECVKNGATIIINLSASPFCIGKDKLRLELIAEHVRRHRVHFVFVNQVGGNDELVFDGTSLYIDPAGTLRTRLPSFVAASAVIDTHNSQTVSVAPECEPVESVYTALVLGLRDYLRKCGFSKVLIGLSGGIDSAVTAAIAVDALGSGNVLGITMPSRYSSGGSVDDSIILAKKLGIECKTIPIEEPFAAFLNILQPHFAGKAPDITEENMQARIRGLILMSFSNKFGYLLLSTGNKSEMAVGYSTLYGDMSGGLSLISDVPKTMIYKIAAFINRNQEIIPQATIDKPPSAELRPDQKDQDTLPPYDILDEILALLIEQNKSAADIIALGYPAETVEWVGRTVISNEYKRRQAAPGLKVTAKAFGVGRRFPIAAKYVW